MKTAFPSYYPPSSDQFSTMWNESLFVLDANVLLDLYRYSQPARDELVGILTGRLAERLWIPHQIALEYMRNRPDVILTQIAIYEKARASIQELLDEDREKKIRSDLNVRHHPFVDAESLLARTREALSKVVEELDQEMLKHPDLLTDDPILDTVTSLLDGKVGEPYPSERLEEIYKEGEERYTNKIPPGYCDAEGSKKKTGNAKYGDLVLWYQTIDKAGETRRSIIVVTNETTEDWWWICKGRTIGPRPELIDEMMSKGHVPSYMYSSDRFMTFAREYLEAPVKQEAIDEVRDVRLRDEETRRQAIDFAAYSSEAIQRLIEAAQYPSESMRRFIEATQYPSESMRRFIEATQYPSESMRRIIEATQYPTESIRRFIEATQYPSESMRQLLRTVQRSGEAKRPNQEPDKPSSNEADAASEHPPADTAESEGQQLQGSSTS